MPEEEGLVALDEEAGAGEVAVHGASSGGSSAAPSAAQGERDEERKIEVGEGVEHEVGVGEGWQGGGGGAELDGEHARGLGGGDAGAGVLHRQAALGRDAEARGGGQEQVRGRLAVRHLAGGDHGVEGAFEVEAAQGGVHPRSERGGGDSDGDAAMAQLADEGADARKGLDGTLEQAQDGLVVGAQEVCGRARPGRSGGAPSPRRPPRRGR